MIDRLKIVLSDVKDEPSLAASLTDKSRILDEVGLNSLQLVIFLMKLEDEFDLELNYESFNLHHMADLSTLADYLANLKMSTGIPAC